MVIIQGSCSTQSLVTAGLGSGLTEGLVITPFERVKVYMQAQRSRMAVVSEMIMCVILISNIGKCVKL